MVTSTPPARPALDASLSAAEFQRWYWLKDELAGFSKRLGIRSAGSNELLVARIAASLDGRKFVEPAAMKRGGGSQLFGPISAETVIPAGQRCSQIVRAWLGEQIGAGFHFDAEMRAFFAKSDGTQTMQDALVHWHASRGQRERQIDPQFEYNRFTRAWYEAHPAGERNELLAAWRAYRASPIDERERA